MALRWYTIVVDCRDVTAQAEWWRETLGWQTVHDAPDEVVIVPAHVTEELARSTPWEQLGPGLVFVPVEARTTRSGSDTEYVVGDVRQSVTS